jgi:hypothetical protein
MPPNVTLEVGNRNRLLADVIEESIFSRRERDDSERIVALPWLDHARSSTHDFSHALLQRTNRIQLRDSQSDFLGELTTCQFVVESPDRKVQTLRHGDLPQAHTA